MPPFSPSSRNPETSIVSAQAERQAGAILTVDLGAVRANYRLMRDLSAPADCAAVVKADAYGLGAARIAPALMQEGCRTFFVAHWAEALALRPLLPAEAALFVLNGLPPGTEIQAAGAEGIAPVLNSRAQAEGWAAAAQARGRALPAALHADTGLFRLGVPAGDLRELAASGLLRRLDLRLLISHLACADEPDHPANAAQLSAFRAARKWFPGVPGSLANSSGIFLGAEFLSDGVRAGAALYGINPLPNRPNPMRPAVRLQARVMQIRDVAAGSGIGYGHDFIAPVPMRTATVGLGYGDGWPRRARTAAWFEGARLPIVGRVSMDSIVLDTSHLSRDAIGPGALVEFLGLSHTVDDLAAAAGTIGYEILTSLGGRPFRQYTDEGYGFSREVAAIQHKS